ncbi:LuxR C-terminal-related transcriptional regulator [Parabacteroides sp. FAFU027]|uniref:LuxR C-terminal-related transcriptional regulator n=1 Tax=Parabacteroides sp. FAFU027 TaxID=2922715 RepID=UPI001FAEFF8E|nr:LuxR C-terminal-related transcriptional regulator [Parabacteroides sp. FAFU027]
MNVEEIPEPYRRYAENAVFANNILHSLPAIIYINQLDVPGNYNSMRNIWLNRRGHELMKYSREEIDQLRYDFFKAIIHPEDMEIVPSSYFWHYSDHPEMFFAGMHRVKPKDCDTYRWLYYQTVVADYFDDGSPKQSFTIALEISEIMHTENQLNYALKEIARLKNELRMSKFTQREREILALIAKGKTDKEIASTLFISVSTAKKHRTNLIAKAEVKNTAELVAFAMESGVY